MLAVLVHLVNSSSCPEDILAVYKIRLETFWSEERFPKQYPQWRPPAQWSKTVGGSLCFFSNYYRDVDKVCVRSSKNYSWIMLACSGFTHPPEFQLFKVKQRWNFVQLTRCPLMEPKRLKTCGNKEPKQLLAVNWWGVISVLRRVCTVVGRYGSERGNKRQQLCPKMHRHNWKPRDQL